MILQEMFSLDLLVKYSLFFKRKWFIIWQMGPSWKKKKILKTEFYLENFLEDNNKLKIPIQVGKKWGEGTKNTLIEWKAKNNLKN